jgi:NAD(P)-dependent dehydrogenase (short-subunit alcohol dehydrogenase family)
MTDAQWSAAFEQVHLSTVRFIRAVLPDMKRKKWGRILAIQSSSVKQPVEGLVLSNGIRPGIAGMFKTLANELAGRIPVFFFSPGLVRTDMTDRFGDDAPWTPPELAPRLARVLASGRADELAGRYIHAEHDDIEDLIRRAPEIRENDLNAIRLRR